MLPLRAARIRARSIAAVAGVVLLFFAPAGAVAGPPASLPGGADSAVANAIGPSLDTVVVGGAGPGARQVRPLSVVPGAALCTIAPVPVLPGLQAGRGISGARRLPAPRGGLAPPAPRGPPACAV